MLSNATWPPGRLVFEDFRRDFARTPVAWHVDGGGQPEAAPLADEVRRCAEAPGRVLIGDRSRLSAETPRLWFPAVYARISANPAEALRVPAGWPLTVFRVLVVGGDVVLSGATDTTWDVHVALRPLRHAPGWTSASTVEEICCAADARARSRQVAAVSAEIERPPVPACKVSVVVCTYHRPTALARALLSLASQTLPARDYEVLVVNNDPADARVEATVGELRRADFAGRPRLRLVECPFAGLSFARNAGIAQARGAVVSFLDDDAIAPPEWLAEVWRAFEANPDAGVVGGTIELAVPEPRPRWLKPGWEKFWGHRVPEFSSARPVDDWWDFPWGGNWSARRPVLVAIGGFRTRYGRRGSDFAGGEEIVAASLVRRLGHAVVVAPSARVVHAPERSRFTLRHVWRRALAARREEYAQHLDRYLPGPIDARSIGGGVRASVRRALAPRVRRPLHVRLEHLMDACAQASLLLPLLRDQWRGRRRPGESAS